MDRDVHPPCFLIAKIWKWLKASTAAAVKCLLALSIAWKVMFIKKVYIY